MSHYSDVETEYTDRDSIVKALVDLGWDEKVIELHDQPVALHDGKRQAHIVIRKKNMKSYAWTDLGFEKRQDGTYKLHIDEMTMGKDWQGRLKARYGYHDTLRIAKTTGHKLRSEEKLPDGSLRLRLVRT